MAVPSPPRDATEPLPTDLGDLALVRPGALCEAFFLRQVEHQA